MKEIQDDDLILYYYGEAEDPEEIRARLNGSPELRARYESLRRTLDLSREALPVPERPESYGAEVWARIEPQLRGKTLDFRPRRAALAWLAAAAVLLLVVGFLAGRHWPRPGEPTMAALPAEARERILTRTVAVHLASSERLLTELANSGTDGAVDLSAERRWAQDLLTANRLYRQSARNGGRPRIAALLDEIEPLLLEIAHGPSEVPADEIEDLRTRIEDQSILFKMRVASQRLGRATL
ncbi:MAG TPA: hypothetical protein VLE27_13340 [Thermoanaerobaculia bacterium]|nr:hypothetical protein [Thermoanaerobaculia bacterium]